VSHFDDHRTVFSLLAAGLAMMLACASSQESPSIPTQPPPQAQQPPQQTSESAGESQSQGESGAKPQRASEAEAASESDSDSAESAQGEAGESAPSESGGGESEQRADSAAAETAESTGEPGETGDSADAAERAGTDAGESGSQQQAGTEGEAQGAEQAGADGDETGAQQRAGAEGEAQGAEQAGADGDETGAQQQTAGAGEIGEIGGAGSEGAPGDPSEIGSGGGGGIPIEEVPPELLEAFGRGAGGEAGQTLEDEELRRALERLAEHQNQVDEMIQHEQTAAAASSGDIGTDSTGSGAAAPPLQGGESGRPVDVNETASSVSTASTDGETDAGAGYRPPADVGSGSDDDTLAAQLRELAMKETDPVLRERYWEEYRKHKGIK